MAEEPLADAPSSTEAQATADTADDRLVLVGPTQGFVKSAMSLLVPVSLCMVMVVATMSSIDFFAKNDGITLPFTPFVSETGNYGEMALMSTGNAFLVLIVLILATTLFYLLYKYGFSKLLHGFFILISFSTMTFFTTVHVLEIIWTYRIPCSIPTILFIMVNFNALGTICIHWKGPHMLQQFYKVTFCAYGALALLKYLPDCTAWFVLAALAIWDVGNVLWKKAPLRRLMEVAEQREDNTFAALVYFTGAHNSEVGPNNASSTSYASSDLTGTIPSSDDTYNQHLLKYARDGSERRLIAVYNPYMDRIDRLEAAEFPKYMEMGALSQNRRFAFSVESEEKEIPTMPRRPAMHLPNDGKKPVVLRLFYPSSCDYSTMKIDLEGSQSPVPKKTYTESKIRAPAEDGVEYVEIDDMNLGLQDFMFYSLLVGKASSHLDWNTTVACFMAILVGLCLTLVLHAMTKKPLPALTISIFTGLLFYFGTRFSITPFISEINHYQIVY